MRGELNGGGLKRNLPLIIAQSNGDPRTGPQSDYRPFTFGIITWTTCGKAEVASGSNRKMHQECQIPSRILKENHPPDPCHTHVFLRALPF